MTTFSWPKPQENRLGILKIYTFCQQIQQRASGPGESAAGVTLSTYENTPKSYHISPLIVAATLVVQGRAQLEHSSHIVKVLVKATCYHFKPWCILKEMTKPAGPFGTMPQES